MILNKSMLLRLVLVALLTPLAIDLGPFAYRAQAQRSGDDDESRDRGGEEERRERRRRFFGGGEGGEFRGGRFGGEGGEFRRRGFGGEGGEFRGRGFGGEGGEFRGRGFGGEGGEFPRRGFGGRDGGGRPEANRNRSENSENDDDDDRERDRRRDQRRDERRDERPNESSAMDPAEYARGLVRERDKNGNMMLEGDELRDLRGPAASADADKNNVVTVDEIVARMSNRETPRNGGEKPAAANAGASNRAASGAAPGMASRVFTALAAPGVTGEKSSAKVKRTYRFTPPGERPGLPSWIKSRDRNKNGQVEMSEYSRNWSQRTVSEFRRYDLNDDGVVTVKEAAAGEAK